MCVRSCYSEWYFVCDIAMVGYPKTKNRNYYNQLLIVNYIALNVIGFIVFHFCNITESYGASLFVYSFMLIMSIGFVVFIMSGILSDYEGVYRKTILDEMIRHMGINMRYTHEDKINSRDFLDSGIINIYKRNYKGWDLVELEYGTQQFKFCNVRIATDSSSPKNNFMGKRRHKNCQSGRYKNRNFSEKFGECR